MRISQLDLGTDKVLVGITISVDDLMAVVQDKYQERADPNPADKERITCTTNAERIAVLERQPHSVKPDPNIAFILAFFFPGVDRMYIGRPGLGVLKLVLVVLFPVWIFFGTAVGALLSNWLDATEAWYLFGLVGFAGPVWWFADLFLIREAACVMQLAPYCIDDHDDAHPGDVALGPQPLF